MTAGFHQDGVSEVQNGMGDLSGEVAHTEHNQRPDAAGLGKVRKE